MRVPINWLKEYVKIPRDLEELTDGLTMAGHMLDKKEVVDGNVVIDLELRGNRADCYSLVGIAREVSALFETPLEYPGLYQKLVCANNLKNINFKFDPKYVRRAMVVVVRDVKVAASPKWLEERLNEYGIASVNNIVDLTNYVMVETGQPLHAFDLNKLGKNLVVRLAKRGEKMTTFLDETIKLTTQDLVWASSGNVISMAGAIGSKEYSLSESTQNILVEAANYDRANIRRSVYRHGLFTDAGIRHEKELDPNLVKDGISRFLELVNENGWGKIENKAYDFYPKPKQPLTIKLDIEYLKRLSGMEIGIKSVEDVLEKLEFKTSRINSNTLKVLCPTYRTDVELEEDLIEEVLRILGYKQIPIKTLSLEVPKDVTPEYIIQEEKVKKDLTSLGFDEVISIPFVKERYLKLNKDPDSVAALPIRVENRPSADVEEMRMNMFTNLLGYVQKVIDERGEQARLFEVGRAYSNRKKYVEKRKVGVIYWLGKGGSYKKFKGFVEAFFEKQRLDGVAYKVDTKNGLDIDKAYSIYLEKEVIGYGWQLGNIYYVEIDLDAVLGKYSPPEARLWPKFPPQIEDITFRLPEKTYLGDVLSQMEKPKVISKVKFLDSYKDYYSFRIWYQDPKKTLTNKEVEEVRNKIIDVVEKKFGGVVK